jgi:hypothetical protein
MSPATPPAVAIRGDERSVWLRPELIASWRQITLVILFCIGPFAGAAAWMALRGSSQKYVQILLSDSQLLLNGAIESGLLSVFLYFLHRRGWRTADSRSNQTSGAVFKGSGSFRSSKSATPSP